MGAGSRGGLAMGVDLAHANVVRVFLLSLFVIVGGVGGGVSRSSDTLFRSCDEASIVNVFRLVARSLLNIKMIRGGAGVCWLRRSVNGGMARGHVHRAGAPDKTGRASREQRPQTSGEGMEGEQ